MKVRRKFAMWAVSTVVAVVAPALALVAVPAPPASAAATDQFDIAVGDTISDGVPGAGAGNIDGPGYLDVYDFEASAGDDVIFDVLAGSAGDFRWSLERVGSTSEVFGTGLFTDRRHVLPESGSYRLTVSGANSSILDTYSFRLLEVPAAQEFPLDYGDTVSPDVPAAGAGNIESPGATDDYSFVGSAGDVVVLDHLAGRNVDIGWTLTAPDGSELLDVFLSDQQIALPATGVYHLVLRGNGHDDVGTYSFQLLGLTQRIDEFDIAYGDTVSDGVPGAGAGNLEDTAAIDRYHFDAVAGEVAIMDVLSGRTTDVRWSLHAPDGSLVLDTLWVDREMPLAQTGTYTIQVRPLFVTRSGTYSFRLSAAPVDVDEFDVALGDTVSDGVPAAGAGNVEVPGAIDRYRFDAAAGQVVRIDALSNSATQVRWSLTAPDGTQVFDAFYTDQQVEADQTGTYTLEVRGQQVASTGTYSFALVDLTPVVEEFVLEPGTVVADGVPGPGAGNLETPGSVDRYVLHVPPPGHRYLFDVHAGDADDFTWTFSHSNGNPAYEGPFVDIGDPIQEGTLTAEVRRTDPGTTGTYSFELVIDPNRPPEVYDDEAEAVGGSSVLVDVLANDDDEDGDPMTVSAVSDPASGTASIQPGGVRYEPDAGFVGEDSFTYTVSDGQGGEGFATVRVTVTEPEFLPVEVEVFPGTFSSEGIGPVFVVLYGSSTIDVDEVDPATILVAGVPLYWLLGSPVAIPADVDADGHLDLVTLLDYTPGAIPPGNGGLALIGLLTDGTEIRGLGAATVLSPPRP